MVRSRSLALAVAIGAVVSLPQLALAAPVSPAKCATAFHAALQNEPLRRFEEIKTKRGVAKEGDARLPGRMMIRPPHVNRDRAERQALKAATQLANARGKPQWISSANSRWIIDRTITDLTDFITQGASPYLCGGVENYVQVLEGYIDRVSTGGGRPLDELVAAQDARARSSIDAALRAMRPAPKPRYAPSVRPIAIVDPLLSGVPPLELRRGFDKDILHGDFILRVSHSGTASPEREAFGPYLDPDLPLKKETHRALTSDAERLAAIADLMRSVGRGGFLGTQTDRSSFTSPNEDQTFRPVLARLEGLKPLVEGRDAIDDPLVRTRLAEALSDLEILEYLRHADSMSADPLVAAIKATFEAILKAREAALEG